jgi:hypothetical protein
MFCLAHRAVLLAPTENAFDHGAARLRHAIAFVPRGAFVDSALAIFAGLGDTVVLDLCEVATVVWRKDANRLTQMELFILSRIIFLNNLRPHRRRSAMKFLLAVGLTTAGIALVPIAAGAQEGSY